MHQSTSSMSTERQIENLIARYAFLVDDGDFAGLGALLAQADFTLNNNVPLRGSSAIERFARDMLMTYDGTPRTRHVTTNLFVEVDAGGNSASSRSYYTVFQCLPDFPLQAIACGGYEDRFERREGHWHFVSRTVNTHFVGDVSRHRRG